MTEIKVPYEEMKFKTVGYSYDYKIRGTCLYNGKIALFRTQDETDYDAMEAACPTCKIGGTGLYDDCTCTTGDELFCYITELTWAERMGYRIQCVFDTVYVCWRELRTICYWKNIERYK